jgi:3',5'-cyclic AMP phosphodiesterase CpdA
VKTIAHLSDLHFGRHDEAVAERLLASLAQDRPDLTVITGDLTQRARRRQFAAARAFIEKLPRPLVVIPGNHDVPLYDVAQRFIGRLAWYRRYICTELQPFFADDEIALLGLNTARAAAFSNGRISYRQAAALREVFAAIPADRLRLLAIHHPLIVPPEAGDLPVVGRAAMALEAIAENHIRVVLSGHYHHTFSGCLTSGGVAWKSVLLVQAGTAVSTRLRDEPNSYNLLRVDGSRVTCAVRAMKENQFVDAETADYTFVGGRWVRA